jgi:hypothetical protein
VYYLEPRIGYAEGTVLDVKKIGEAERDWEQKWSKFKSGTIIKIQPLNAALPARYRHQSSVITPDQYNEKQAVKLAITP